VNIIVRRFSDEISIYAQLIYAVPGDSMQSIFRRRPVTWDCSEPDRRQLHAYEPYPYPGLLWMTCRTCHSMTSQNVHTHKHTMAHSRHRSTEYKQKRKTAGIKRHRPTIMLIYINPIIARSIFICSSRFRVAPAEAWKQQRPNTMLYDEIYAAATGACCKAVRPTYGRKWWTGFPSYVTRL
jgi:hypothetical protein